jgi:hypothetical protein
MVFWDSKRLVTKKLLQHIDVRAVLAHADCNHMLSHAEEELRTLVPDYDRGKIVWPSSLEELLLGQPAAGVSGQPTPR